MWTPLLWRIFYKCLSGFFLAADYLFPLMLPSYTSEKSLASSSLEPCDEWSKTQMRFSHSIFFFRLNKNSSPSLSLHMMCCSSLVAILVTFCWTVWQFVNVFLYWEAPNWRQYSRYGLTSAECMEIFWPFLSTSATLSCLLPCNWLIFVW